jgi:hypothetical protein
MVQIESKSLGEQEKAPSGSKLFANSLGGAAESNFGNSSIALCEGFSSREAGEYD